MDFALRTKPISRDEGAAVDTDGSAFALPTTVTCRQFKIYVSGAAYVGLGADDSPPAAAESNSVHQEASTEVVYTLDGIASRDGSHVYVYAAAGTVICRISFFG